MKKTITILAIIFGLLSILVNVIGTKWFQRWLHSLQAINHL